MIELVQSFADDIRTMPLWVQIWLARLGVINIFSLRYAFGRTEARWALLAFVAAFAIMMGLYGWQGFTRLLGLGHILAWTPLLIYLWRRRSYIHLNSGVGVWLHLLFVTNFISLTMDYTDLVRHFLGHGY